MLLVWKNVLFLFYRPKIQHCCQTCMPSSKRSGAMLCCSFFYFENYLCTKLPNIYDVHKCNVKKCICIGRGSDRFVKCTRFGSIPKATS